MASRALLLVAAFSCLSASGLPKAEMPDGSPAPTPAPGGTYVENSVIENRATGDNNASGGSTINRGIEARSSTIVDSSVTNTTAGNVNASSSTVDTGIKLNGAEVRGSDISANTNVSINATGSSVSTGSISLSGANGANISTNVSGSVNAKNSTVRIGTITGSADGVDAHTNVGASVSVENKSVSIGNINLNAGGGGSGGGYKDRHEKPSPGQKGGGASIGNVVVESSKVDEVNVTVGDPDGGVGDKIKTRNMANTFKDKDGVAPDGTKNVYVSKQEAEAAERKAKRGGSASAGDTRVGNDEKDRDVRKVNVYVDK